MGDSVALLCPQYNERPQIGKILKMSRKVATIRSYDGTWSGRWRVYTYKVRKRTMRTEEEVKLEEILEIVNFTKEMKISMSMKRKLQTLYSAYK